MVRIKKILIIAPLISCLAFIMFACEEKLFTLDVDCDECYTQKPDSVDLIFHWTQENDSSELPLLLYKGTIDEGKLIDTFYLFKNPAYIWVKANEEHSVRALYERDNKTIWVVDATKPKVKLVTETCDDGDCWYVVKADMNIELKY